MKTLKLLLTSFIVVFFLSTGANAQSKSVIWEQDMCFPCPCANDGEGEILCGTIIFHVVENANVVHWNIIGGKLTGDTTGKTYHFSRTSTYKPSTGELVLNVRTKGENGLTTFWQIIGEAGIDEYGEYYPMSEENMKFYCR